jgi:hypothetical protein
MPSDGQQRGQVPANFWMPAENQPPPGAFRMSSTGVAQEALKSAIAHGWLGVAPL